MKRFSLLLTLFIILAISLFAVPAASNLQAQAYRGLIIDQYLFDFGIVQPGSIIQGSFTVTHDYQPLPDGSVKVVDVTTRSADFTQSDRPGVPLFLEKGTLDRQASLSEWINIQQSQIILDEQSEEATINFTIKVPEDAEPGGKYASILLANEEGDDIVLDYDGGAAFGLNSELGALIFLTVEGDNEIDINLDSLNAQSLRGNRPPLFIATPMQVVANFENTGNVHGFPRGVIFIGRPGQDINEVNPDYVYQFNTNESLVLPATEREYSQLWGEDAFFINEIRNDGSDRLVFKFDTDNNFFDWKIGFYQATLQYDYQNYSGQSAPATTKTVQFFVLPWPLLLIILLLALLIAYIIYRAYNRQEEGERKR